MGAQAEGGGDRWVMEPWPEGKAGKGQAGLSQSCLCLPGSEATEAWLRQEASLLPSHRESRSTMLLCAMPLAVFWDLRFTLVLLSFCQIDPEVPEKGLPTWSLSEMVLVRMGLAGMAGNSGEPQPLTAAASLVKSSAHG